MPKALVVSDLIFAGLHGALSFAGFWAELSQNPLGLLPYRVTAEAATVVLAIVGDVLILKSSAKGRDVAFGALIAVGVASALVLAMALTHTGCPPVSIASIGPEIGIRLAYNGAYLSFLLRAGRGRSGAPRVFINYRHSDAQSAALAIREQLVGRLGHGKVFLDNENLRIGEAFAKTLLAEAGSTDALLVLVTPRWSELTDDLGRRRLDDPEDFVVREIAAALAGGVLLVPVLLDGAKMPSSAELPESIRGLADLHGVKVNSSQLQNDVRLLSKKLRSALPPDPQARASRGVIVLVAILLVGAVAVLFLPGRATNTAVLKTASGTVIASSDGSCRDKPQLVEAEPGDEIHHIHVHVQNLQKTPVSIMRHDVVSLLDGKVIPGYKYKPVSPVAIAPGAITRLVIPHDLPLAGRARDHVDRFDTDGCGATQAVRVTTSEGVLPLVSIDSIGSCGVED